jgi:hypothetical protein
MLFNMATAAMQTLGSGTLHRLELKGEAVPVPTEQPAFIGQCHTWAQGGATTQRFFPMFFQVPGAPSGSTSES